VAKYLPLDGQVRTRKCLKKVSLGYRSLTSKHCGESLRLFVVGFLHNFMKSTAVEVSGSVLPLELKYINVFVLL
jgi:hypothetical protein